MFLVFSETYKLAIIRYLVNYINHHSRFVVSFILYREGVVEQNVSMAENWSIFNYIIGLFFTRGNWQRR